MKTNIVGLVICVLFLIFSISGLRENITAVWYVILMFASGIGLTYFGWSLIWSLFD
jgi:hypothetical protein